MRIPTSLLPSLALASPNGAAVAITDQELEVPPGILPIMQAVHPQSKTFPTFVTTDLQRESFFFTANVIHTSAALSDDRLCTFGKGLWDLEFSMWMVTNFSDFLAIAQGCRLSMGHDFGNTLVLMEFEPVTNVVQIQTTRRRMLLADDGWLVQFRVAAAGVSETIHAKCQVHASKLL